jgi:WD40 repeat protein
MCVLQITYWDAYDGQAIRIIEGSAQAQVNTLCTDPAGEALLSGGGDRLVKVWGYDEGLVSVLAQLHMRGSAALLCGCF